MAKPNCHKTEVEEALTAILDEIRLLIPITKRTHNKSHILITLSIPITAKAFGKTIDHNVLIVHTKYPLIEIDDGTTTIINLSDPGSIVQIIETLQLTIDIYTRYQRLFT